jgi:hypothetical protein
MTECLSPDLVFQREVMIGALLFFLGFLSCLGLIVLSERSSRRPTSFGEYRSARKEKLADHGRRGIHLVRQDGEP